MLGQYILSDNEQGLMSLRAPENKSSGTARVPKSQRKKRAVAETPSMEMQESIISDSDLSMSEKRRTRSQRKNANPVDNKLRCLTAKVLE